MAKENWGAGIGTSWGIFSAFNVASKYALLGSTPFALTSLGVAIIVNAFLTPKKEKEKSPSYDWKRTGNQTASHELPMPVVYGKARIKPVIKNTFVTTEGGKKYLNRLYGFTGHRIGEASYDRVIANRRYSLSNNDIVRSLSGQFWDTPGQTYKAVKENVLGETYALIGTPSDPGEWVVWSGTALITDIEINGNPIDDYINGNYDDVHYEARQGLANQAYIAGFDKTYSDLPQDTILTEGVWTTVQSSSVVAQNIEITLFFPEGLYRVTPLDKIDDRGVGIDIQYREIGTDTWLNIEDFQFGKYSAIRTRAGLSTYHLNFTKEDPFYRSFTVKNRGEYLEIGKMYEVRMKKSTTSAPVGVKRVVDTVQLVNVSTISYAQDSDADGSIDGLIYPGEAILGVKIRASEDLSGDIELTGVVERSTVKVYNGTSWVDKDANIHAWACYDLLANGHPDHPCYPNTTNDADEIMSSYGAGVDKDRLDYDSFNDWATEVGTSLGYELNIVFDTFTTVWDAILKICQEGRGIIFPVGSKYKALPDVPKTPTSLFCMGNIDLGTFRRQWIDKAKKANSLELTFWDEDFNWRRTTFVLRTPDWDTSEELPDSLDLELQGTTGYAQAFQTGIYYLNCNENLNQIISLQSNIETLDIEVGDTSYVQHDTLIGSGGKVVSYTGTTLTLDKTVTLEAGKTYEIYIQTSAGTIEHKTGITGGVPTNQIVWDPGVSWGTEPKQYDNWAFGEIAVKLFRVIDISANSQYTREITLMEYSANVYIDSTGDSLSIGNAEKIIPDLNRPDFTPFNTASNLEVHEILSRNRATGEYESSIHVTWKVEEGDPTGEWEVSMRDIDSDDPGWKGEWDNTTSYDQWERVEHNGFTYIALEDNDGVEPINR